MLRSSTWTLSPWIPAVQAEETLFSYYARSRLLCGHTSQKALAPMLFGPKEFSTEIAASGCKSYAQTLGAFLECLDAPVERDALSDLSLAVLGKPFTNRFNQRRPEKGCRSTQLRAVWGMRDTYIRRTPAFCPECLKSDLERLGFSYWRRSHQIQGVSFCPTHNCGLLTNCDRCCAPFSTLALPSMTCSACGSGMKPGLQFEGSAQDYVKLRFAEAVEGVYLGRITGPLNPARVQGHFHDQYSRKSATPGADLSKHVIRSAGTEFLEELSLSFSMLGRYQWPIVFYADHFILEQAARQLLVYACVAMDEPREDLFMRQCPKSDNWVVNESVDRGVDELINCLRYKGDPVLRPK